MSTFHSSDNTPWIVYWRMMPIELRAFAVFCLLATIASFAIGFLAPDHIREAIIPNTGGLLGMMYAFNLTITLSNISSAPGLKKRIAIQWVNIALLIATVIFQILIISNYKAEYAANPYLSAGPFRFVWVMVIPAIWIAILLSPMVTRYCTQEQASTTQ